MTTLKNALIAGAASIFAVTVGVPATKADTVQIWQCTSCSGSSNSASALAQPGNTVANTGAGNTYTNQVFSIVGTYTGTYNFNDTATNTINGFFATGTGTFTAGTYTPGFSGISAISTGPTGTSGVQTEFVFGGITIASASTVTITHDDGIALFLGSTLLTPTNDTAAHSALPTDSEITTYSLLAGTYTLDYVASNGLPEILNMVVTPTVPLPASVWLFGAALGGLGLLSRRRRKGHLALAA